jgi:indolepyruvate ferredoxin oxidoreductase
VGLAELPDEIRGYGHVKERNLKAAKALEEKASARLSAIRSRCGKSPEPDRGT